MSRERLDLGVGFGDRGVADDHTGEPVAVEGGSRDGHEAPHAVTDDDRWPGDAAGIGNSDDFRGPLLEGVGIAVLAVAVAGQVDRQHPEFVGEASRHVRPPVGVGPAAVDEHEAPPARLAPGEVVDARRLHLDEAIGERHRQCPTEPSRGVRVQRARQVGHVVDATANVNAGQPAS